MWSQITGEPIWFWFSLAVALAVVEVLAPGFIFMWLAVAAAVMGVITWISPDLSTNIQLVLFAVLSVAIAFSGYRFFPRMAKRKTHLTLNRRGDAQLGKTVVVVNDTVNGHGQGKVADSVWSIRVRPENTDLAAGNSAKVVEIKGNTLIVEALPTTGRAAPHSSGPSDATS